MGFAYIKENRTNAGAVQLCALFKISGFFFPFEKMSIEQYYSQTELRVIKMVMGKHFNSRAFPYFKLGKKPSFVLFISVSIYDSL